MTPQQPFDTSFSPAEVGAEIARLQTWRHRIRIGGQTTPGTDDSDGELSRLNIGTDLRGVRALDVGCSDGFFSFEMERRGASEVLAIDDQSSLLSDGQNGFQTAKRLIGSSVDYQILDVERLNPDEHGLFDLVLFVNVLYHLRNPMAALSAIRSVTAPGGSMILKSYFQADVRFWVKGRCFDFDVDRRPKMWFYPSTELAGDPTNWFGPNRRGLEGLLTATGWQWKSAGRHLDRLYYVCTNPATVD